MFAKHFSFDFYDIATTSHPGNRVGKGIAPPPSHTTVHALAHGGFP